MAIYKRHGEWFVDFYFQGKRIRKKAGTRKDAAENALSRIRCKIIAGDFISPHVSKRISRQVSESERARIEQDTIDALRTRITKLREQERCARESLAALQRVAIHLSEFQYPSVPEPFLNPTKQGDGLPNRSGIYFLWHEGAIMYVGQSVNLRNRVRLSHNQMLPGDRVSFVEIDRGLLNYAEPFYIGLVRPARNGVWRPAQIAMNQVESAEERPVDRTAVMQ